MNESTGFATAVSRITVHTLCVTFVHLETIFKKYTPIMYAELLSNFVKYKTDRVQERKETVCERTITRTVLSYTYHGFKKKRLGLSQGVVLCGFIRKAGDV